MQIMIEGALTAAASAIFFSSAIKTLKFTRNLPLLKHRELTSNRFSPTTTIIIPCCNEAAALARLTTTGALRIRDQNVRFLLVDDRSTDETPATLHSIAQSDDRVTVLTIRELPGGWLGKNNALKQGSEIATGEWFVYTDADTQFSETALARAHAEARARGLDFLGVLPQQRARSVIYRTLVAFFEHANGTMVNLDRMWNPKYPDTYGSGAFALVRAAALKQSQGWEWLRLEVIGDWALPHLIKKSGGQVGRAHGSNEISIEWYDSAGALMRGVEKNAPAILDYSLSLAIVSLLFGTLWISAQLLLPFMLQNPFLWAVEITCFALFLVSAGYQYW